MKDQCSFGPLSQHIDYLLKPRKHKTDHQIRFWRSAAVPMQRWQPQIHLDSISESHLNLSVVSGRQSLFLTAAWKTHIWSSGQPPETEELHLKRFGWIPTSRFGFTHGSFARLFLTARVVPEQRNQKMARKRPQIGFYVLFFLKWSWL